MAMVVYGVLHEECAMRLTGGEEERMMRTRGDSAEEIGGGRLHVKEQKKRTEKREQHVWVPILCFFRG